MAIKIAGTTVIDNSRNITDVENVGDANTIYFGNGSNLTGIGGGGIKLLTSNTTLTAGAAFLLNPSSSITLTLPASPSSGDALDIMNNVEFAHPVLRNGSTINGVAEDLTIDQVGVKFKMWYDGSTWRLF